MSLTQGLRVREAALRTVGRSFESCLKNKDL